VRLPCEKRQFAFFVRRKVVFLRIEVFENITAMASTTASQIQFATLAIGATAQRMGITATELFNRLKHHGLV
jgi:hypothetical protein